MISVILITMFSFMYRASILKRIIVGITLWVISTPTYIHAQRAFQPPYELKVQGNVPIIDLSSTFVFANDDKGNTWYVSDTGTWSFSVDSLKWTRWPSVNFEDVEVQIGYDKAADRFLFWNWGVGKVFTWNPGDTVMQRIDRSFHHRTQYYHAWFIHPKTSDIYAFGGYGFWGSRGYTTRFDHITKEWQVVALDATKSYPSNRFKSLQTYDEKRNQFHIFGGYDFKSGGREDLSIDNTYLMDYWILDVDRREWRTHTIYRSTNSLYEKPNFLVIDNHYMGLTDNENDLAWYPIKSMDGVDEIQLMVFDYERGFGAVTPLNLGDLGMMSFVKSYKYDHQSNQLILYWAEKVSRTNKNNPIRVSALQLPHPDSTRAMMDLIREYGSIDPPSEASNPWAWLWVLLPLGLGSALAWHHIRGRSSVEGFIDGNPAAAPQEITFCFLGEPKILVDGVVVKNTFSSPEFEILLWLYWKQRRGEPYQITDTIETVFWQDSPNIDYIRKQRNTSIRRLNEQLAALFKPKDVGHEWIVDRMSNFDRRKREYALDLGGLIVRCDLDAVEPGAVDPSGLLESQTGIWVTQIRSEYALLSAAS